MSETLKRGPETIISFASPNINPYYCSNFHILLDCTVMNGNFKNIIAAY